MVIFLQDILDPLIDQIDSNQIISANNHIFAVLVYSLLFLISIYFAYRFRKGFIDAGQWDQGYLGKSVFGSIIGLSILISNFFITHIWLYLSNGTEFLMFNEKGMVAAAGFLLFQFLFPYASLIIVHLSDPVKRAARIFLWTATGVASIGFLIALLSVLNILSFEGQIILPLLLIGIIMGVLLTFTIILLFRESNNSFSKINKVRLRILVLGVVFFVIDLGSILITFATRTGDPELFVLWLYFIQPAQRFITLTIIFSLFYLSFFFPLWLQERTGALPPSFEQLMKKRRSMQWNKIVQREKAEQEEAN